MKVLAIIGQFLYDLLVGDSWPLTLAVVITIGLGIAVMSTGRVAPAVIALTVALVIAAVAPLVVIFEARAARRQPD